MDKNEIELIDFLDITWKRKWLIIIPTFVLVILAGVISFLLPPKWEVDVIIEPAKFLSKTTDGKFEEVIVADPKKIAGQINQATYNNVIAAELKLDIREFPKLKAENLEDTTLVRISTKEKDVEKAKSIFNSLYNRLKADLDTKVNVEMKDIDSEMKSTEIEKFRVVEENKRLKNKLNIVKQRKKEIENEMSEASKRIDTIEKEQQQSLRKQGRSEAESLGLLLYSNEIQQSLRYYNALNELLGAKKMEEEDLNIEIENNEKRINKLDNTIINLEQRKKRIDFTRLTKVPTPSVQPVFPKKKLNIVIAGVLSLVIFTILAFFLEYVEKQREKKI